MIENSDTGVLSDGKSFFTKCWLPDDMKVRANIILVHGIGEYCERYQHVAKFLTDNGFAVYSFDHIGHGKSDGKRGAMNYNMGFEIINKLKAEMMQSTPDIPIIVYGHSMGGGIVLAYGTLYSQDVSGIIATSPAVGMANPMSPFMIGLMKILRKIAPNFTISNGLNSEGISHDNDVVKRYQEDPLVHDKVSVALGMDLISWGDTMLKYTDTYPVPLLVVQGSEDKLVDPVATEQFATTVKGNVTYKRFEGGYHEMHNEPNKEELFSVILEWVNTILAND